MTNKSTDISWHDHAIQRSRRAEQKGQKPCMIWFTGLSGAGKSTVANALDCLLFEKGRHTYLLDGDNVRHGLNRDLGFSDTDERRVGKECRSRWSPYH